MIVDRYLFAVLATAAILSGCSEEPVKTPTETPESTVSAPDYATSYAVVVSEKTYADPEWKKVADALVRKHDATLVKYDGNVAAALPGLQRAFPKYTCFVATPEEAGFNHILEIHRMTRKLDDDPYGDTLWGVVTGYTPADALRVAQAVEPRVVGRVLLTAGMGPSRWREARFISTAKPGETGRRTADGGGTRETRAGDLTRFWVEAWNEMDPDAVVSSAHASQRNLEMPFSRGNIVCRNGKLFGYVTAERMIDEQGKAIEKKIPGKLLKLDEPKNPKLYFAVGNCLIGDIPDKECMALAMMGFGKVNQMIGYTVTTWYGKAGWGTLKHWEQMGGVAPLNESFYFNNAELIHRLSLANPGLPGVEWEVGDRDLEQKNFMKAIKQVLGDAPVTRDVVGLCHDRDVVAFYGDPALEIRLDREHTLPARRTIDLEEKDGVWTATIHAHTDHGEPNAKSTAIGILFPRRLKNLTLVSGEAYAPVLTDNHLLVTAPGPFKAGEDYPIVFKAEPIN